MLVLNKVGHEVFRVLVEELAVKCDELLAFFDVQLLGVKQARSINVLLVGAYGSLKLDRGAVWLRMEGVVSQCGFVGRLLLEDDLAMAQFALQILGGVGHEFGKTLVDDVVDLVEEFAHVIECQKVFEAVVVLGESLLLEFAEGFNELFGVVVLDGGFVRRIHSGGGGFVFAFVFDALQDLRSV